MPVSYLVLFSDVRIMLAFLIGTALYSEDVKIVEEIEYCYFKRIMEFDVSSTRSRNPVL